MKLSTVLALVALILPTWSQGVREDRPQTRSIPVTAPAQGLSVSQGSILGGGVGDLTHSDAAVVDVRATSDFVRVVLNATSPAACPARIDFAVEARAALGFPAPIQEIELFDFTAGSYVSAGTRVLTPGTDTLTHVVRRRNAARFVEPGTLRLQTRLSFDWNGAAGQPAVALDRALWSSRIELTERSIDLRGYDAPSLNTSAGWIRTVFDLNASRMQATPQGVQLTFDVTDPGPYDYTFRSELRETNNTTHPPEGTSQLYRMHFEIDELPDLYGPTTIFQRFNRTLDGPDIEVELTGANQFFDAVPNDLQVVAFGQRLRLGKMLKPKNELAVVIYNALDGKYKVSLNGETLHEATGVDTRASTQGSWVQFGLYPHGLHDPQNRADQIASGFTRASFIYAFFEKYSFDGEANLDAFETTDPN